MIGCLKRVQAARLATSGELANLHFRLGVDGDPERFWVPLGFGVALTQVVEDGVGLRNFFLGTVLRTRRRRYPRRFKMSCTVRSAGTGPWRSAAWAAVSRSFKLDNMLCLKLLFDYCFVQIRTPGKTLA